MPTFRQDEKLGTKVPLIKTADFNDKSVTTEKLAEDSVTNSKLAPESVTQDKFDKELLQIFKAAAGLPENLIETIQNVDTTLADHQRQISSNDDDISDLQTKTKQIKDTVDGIAISGGASVGSAVTYDNTQSGLDAQNIQNAIDELVTSLKDEFSYKGIAKPTTNPGVPDSKVFYIAGEGSYPNFGNQVVEIGQIAVLKWDGSWHKEVLEIGAGGGNMILEWNTDTATTRKQVVKKMRKAGIQISYKDPLNGWINEQYIGTSFTDLEWVKDKNWERIVSQTKISISDSSEFNAFFSDFKIYGTLNVTDAVKIQIQTVGDNVYIKAMLNGGSESGISGASIPKLELIANTHILWEFSNGIIIEGILAKNIDVSWLTANIITKNVYYNDIYNINSDVKKIYQYNIKDVSIQDWEINTRYVYNSKGNKIEKRIASAGYSSLLIPIKKGYSVDNINFIKLNDTNTISCIVDSELNVLEKNTPKAHYADSAYLCISKYVGSTNINNPEVYEFQLGYNPSRIGDDDYVNVVWDKCNYKLDNEAGTEVAQSQCVITDFIPVNENTVFLFYNLNQAYSQCVFKYDKDKSFLGFIPLNNILRYGDWYILRNNDADTHYYRFSTWWNVSQRLYIANSFNIDRICNDLGIICKDVLDDYFKVTIYEGSSVVDNQNIPINDGDIIRKHQFPIIITSEATTGINNKGVKIKPLYFTYKIGKNTSIEENCIFVEQDVEVTYPENLKDDKWYKFGCLNWFTRKQGRRAKSLDWCQNNDWQYCHKTNKAIFKIYGFKIIDKRKELYNTPIWWLPTIGKLIKFGDSITADTTSYAGLLGKILNWTVQDATIVGYSIPAIWQKHKSSITGNYDLATFSGGTNGGYSNPLDQPQNAEKKYSEIIRQRDDNTLIGILNSFIDKVRETNPYCPVIIINPWEPFSNFKEDDTNENGNSRASQWMQNKIDMQNVAVERGCLFYDTQQHIPLCPEMFSMANDGGVHPSASLQRLWSIEFYLWLAKMLNP